MRWVSLLSSQHMNPDSRWHSSKTTPSPKQVCVDQDETGKRYHHLVYEIFHRPQSPLILTAVSLRTALLLPAFVNKETAAWTDAQIVEPK